MPRGMESSMNDADGNNLIKSQTLNTVIQFSFKPTFYFFFPLNCIIFLTHYETWAHKREISNRLNRLHFFPYKYFQDSFVVIAIFLFKSCKCPWIRLKRSDLKNIPTHVSTETDKGFFLLKMRSLVSDMFLRSYLKHKMCAQHTL